MQVPVPNHLIRYINSQRTPADLPPQSISADARSGCHLLSEISLRAKAIFLMQGETRNDREN